MENKEIRERVFQKSGEIDEEKQQDIVATHLNVEEYAHLSRREVLVLISKVIDREEQIDQEEQGV
jgi:hypothetical protein